MAYFVIAGGEAEDWGVRMGGGLVRLQTNSRLDGNDKTIQYPQPTPGTIRTFKTQQEWERQSFGASLSCV